jgi:hypothetical protein
VRPRIRSLKPEMWADEKIGALSRDARLLLLGMVTLADDEGRLRCRKSELHGYLFPDDDDAPALIPEWIAEIKTQGIVIFYIADGTPYGAFRNWRRHQKINKPTPSTLPPPPSPRVVRDNSVTTKGVGTEDSGSPTVALSDLAGSSHSPTRGRALRSDPDQFRSLLQNGSEFEEPQRALLLSALLAAHVVRNDPKAEVDPENHQWVTDMRLLVVDRKGDVAEVIRIIDWCQADSFWRSNILSPAKLRKQFTQLTLRAQGAEAGASVTRLPRRENASDLLRAINEKGAA